jgi:hypothetical protein
MNVKQARKILGDQAINLPDEVILQDIKTAEVLKSLFFQSFLKAKKAPIIYNKTNNGKT